MRRWLPHPFVALFILVVWLLLNQAVTPGQLLLGAAVGVLGSRFLALLRPQPARIRSFRPLPRLAAVVLADVVRSNIAVARIVLLGGGRKRVSGFVNLPLELRDINGLAVLACIVTATPGTLWVQYNRKSDRVLIHILDLIDEDEWVRTIKYRYERPLLEMFG